MQSFKITSLGQLEDLLKRNLANKAIPNIDKRLCLSNRCQIAKTWVDSWRYGRCKPVDLIVLEESKVITKTFINSVSELADNLHGDAESLLKALREGKVKKFYSENIKMLHEYL